MPTRPRPKKGHRFTHAKGRLNQRTRDELAETAGLDPAGRDALVMIDEVEEILSDAANLRDSVERGPSSAGRAELLRHVELAAHSLERALLNLDQGSLMNFDSPFIDDVNESAIVDDLVDLRTTAKEMRESALKDSRRGRANEGARDEAIKSLAWVFHERADPSIKKEYRPALVAFVGIALGAAKFSAPGLERSKAKDRTEGRKTWQRIDPAHRRPR